MPNEHEQETRDLARNVIEAGLLPRRDPDRTWGRPGMGLPCLVCGERIPPDQVEYELHYVHDGATPGLDRFHLHLRCFTAWDLERTKPPPR